MNQKALISMKGQHTVLTFNMKFVISFLRAFQMIHWRLQEGQRHTQLGIALLGALYIPLEYNLSTLLILSTQIEIIHRSSQFSILPTYCFTYKSLKN